MTRTAIVFGGPSVEHEISILTGLQCERALNDAGVQTSSLYWSVTGEWFEVPAGTEAKDYTQGAPKSATPLQFIAGGTNSGWSKPGGRLRGAQQVEVDRVLNCCHGGPGESGGLAAMMQLIDVPCTGGSPITATLGMDKLSFGAVMAAHDLPTLPRVAVTESSRPTFDGPYIMKPRAGGSSIGITTVEDYDSALDLASTGVHYRGGAVLEPYRNDLFDLNVAFRTAPELTTSMIEKPTRSEGSEFYDYSEKYLQRDGLSASPRELPAKIDADLEKRIHDLARKVAQVTGITGVIRVDFLSNGSDELYVNELNAIPGAMALYLWGKDVALADLLTTMLDQAAADHKRTRISASISGEALGAADGIAAKLAGYRGDN